jgi:phosphate transport system permease protein
MSEQPSNLQLRAPFTTSDFIRRKERREQMAKWFFGFMAAAMIVPLLLILAKVIITGLPSMTWEFFTENPRRGGTQGGIWPALVGTLYLIAISLCISAPIGILAAVYLNEYARDNWFTRLVSLAVGNLAGVPSEVHGLFGLGAFVYALGMGKSVMAASLTLAIMTLLVIIASSKDALSAVPMSFREACWNVGASRWQTIWRVVLPNSISGILTGVILQVSRAAGETDGKPRFTAETPSRAIRRRPSSYWSSVGLCADGLCRPSRRVSSRIAIGRAAKGEPAPSFQS